MVIFIHPLILVTWTQQTSAGSRYWYSVAISVDGTKLIATAGGDYIYTYTSSPPTSSPTRLPTHVIISHPASWPTRKPSQSPTRSPTLHTTSTPTKSPTNFIPYALRG